MVELLTNKETDHTNGDSSVRPSALVKTAEEQLDAMLQLRENRKRAQLAAKPEPIDPIEVFRRMVEVDFVPVLDELAAKYVSKGIILEWDLSSLLAGGRELIFEFTLHPVRVRLKGTMVRDVLAFEIIRNFDNTGGEVCSGPMLSIRKLNPQMFREFICEQIALIIRSVMRLTRR